MTTISLPFILPDEGLHALRNIFEANGDSLPDGIESDWNGCNAICDAIVQGRLPILGDEQTFVRSFLESTWSCPTLTREQCAGAARQLGALAYDGRFSETCEPDYAEAVAWYERAAGGGDIQAIINLGYCHQYGRSIPRSMDKAFACYLRAALLSDHPEALYKLGDMYRSGKGTAKDGDVASALYSKAWHMLSSFEEDAPELRASIAIRLADMRWEGFSAGCGFSLEDVLDEALEILSMYQIAETGFRKAIANGFGYYAKQLDRAVEGQQAVRDMLDDIQI